MHLKALKFGGCCCCWDHQKLLFRRQVYNSVNVLVYTAVLPHYHPSARGPALLSPDDFHSLHQNESNSLIQGQESVVF